MEHEIELAIEWLYLMANVSQPNARDKDIAYEAITYADINNFTEKPMTHEQWANKRRFEIKCLTYFMCKKYSNSFEVVKYFKEYERIELHGLAEIVSLPLFEAE